MINLFIASVFMLFIWSTIYAFKTWRESLALKKQVARKQK